MTATLLDLSGKIDRLPLSLFETFASIAPAADSGFFVVGATARDMILEHGYGRRSARATNDVDLGICVGSWNEYNRLVEELLATGHFGKEREAQRFLYRGELLVDILPFGEIAGPNKEIHWPPGDTVVMSVAGFEDAFKSAIRVKVRANPSLEISVASLVGLTVMKLVGWADRPSERSRDALDLAHILENYLDAGNDKRLLEEHSDLVDVADFDYVRAGARLLGRDIGHIACSDTKERAISILEAETIDQSRYLLLRQMMPSPALSQEEGDKLFAESLNLLRELRIGIQES